jgi:DNA-binding LacI/PurR family transcriptional regulator
VLVRPTVPMVRWLQAQDTPVFALGGAIGDLRDELDGAGTPITEALKVAGSHLVKKGHRRILVALPPLHIPNKAKFIDSALSTWALDHTREELDTFIRFHEVFAPAALQDNWRKWLPELEPTAVVVSSTKALLSLLGFCRKAGIRVPADLSVVSANWEPMLKWMNPEVTAVRLADNDIGRWALNWLRTPPLKPKGLRQFLPSLVAGKTVLPPRSPR